MSLGQARKISNVYNPLTRNVLVRRNLKFLSSVTHAAPNILENPLAKGKTRRNITTNLSSIDLVKNGPIQTPSSIRDIMCRNIMVRLARI